MSFNADKKKTLDSILHTQGYIDYKWINPTQTIMDRYAFLLVH